MRLFILFILCCIAFPIWAAPSLIDLDSWQLPEDEPETVSFPRPVVVKPTEPKKNKTTKDPELKVQLTENGNYKVASSTQEASEIAVMSLSAQQLLSRFAGKSRFYILFNANMPATVDTEIKDENGTKYAMAVFGNQNQKYRILLFKNGTEQPLIAVADNMRGKLDMFQKYRVDVGITEKEIKKSEPTASVQEISDPQTQKKYHIYKLEGPRWVVFESDKLTKQFTNEQEVSSFTNQLQRRVPSIEVRQHSPAPERDDNRPPVQSQPVFKRKFSRIVQNQSPGSRIGKKVSARSSKTKRENAPAQ